MTTLIKNGLVVSPQGAIAADVLIDGEKIAAVLTPGDTSLGNELTSTSEWVIDAAGKYVIPGGVDSHTHMESHICQPRQSPHPRSRSARSQAKCHRG